MISPDLGQAELRAAYEAHEEERARTHRQYDAAVRAMEVQGHEMRAQALAAQAEKVEQSEQQRVEMEPSTPWLRTARLPPRPPWTIGRLRPLPRPPDHRLSRF